MSNNSTVSNLAMLVRRMANRLLISRKYVEQDKALAESGLLFLRRNGFLGTPLRNATVTEYGAALRDPLADQIIRQLKSDLEHAIKCVAYCRTKHPDVQNGSGFPIEAMWLSSLNNARAFLQEEGKP